MDKKKKETKKVVKVRTGIKSGWSSQGWNK